MSKQQQHVTGTVTQHLEHIKKNSSKNRKDVFYMTRHSGPKISKAAKTLANTKSNSKQKSEAGKVLAEHKHKYH